MRISAFLLTLLTTSVLLFLLAPSSATGGQSCQDLLDNTLYRCQVKSDFDTAFEDCFQFTSPGLQSINFDLSIDMLGETLGCACTAGGSFSKPQFSASRTFHCVTPAFAFLSIAFGGQVIGHGNKIKQGQAVNEFGDSFVYECVPDPRCSTFGPLRGRRNKNPYVGDKR